MSVSRRIVLTGTAVLIAAGAVAYAGTAASAQTGAAPPATSAAHTPVPAVVTAWAAAWNGTDPEHLSRLFTPDATYTDYAVGAVSTGHDEIAAWKGNTDKLIAGVHIEVQRAFRSGDDVAVQSVYSGTIAGAPTPFAVPSTTILKLRHGLISSDEDYYNLAAVLAQSGLPADWTPPRA